VIASAHLFFQLSHYAPPELASRFVYLADRAAALHYLKTDTVELGMQEFGRWTPMSIEDYHSYLRAHPASCSLGTPARGSGSCRT
jgi:hypothetical protein